MSNPVEGGIHYSESTMELLIGEGNDSRPRRSPDACPRRRQQIRRGRCPQDHPRAIKQISDDGYIAYSTGSRLAYARVRPMWSVRQIVGKGRRSVSLDQESTLVRIEGGGTLSAPVPPYGFLKPNTGCAGPAVQI